MDDGEAVSSLVRRAIYRGYAALNRLDASRARGPAAERIDGVDDTFRVESYGNGDRFVHAEICLHDEAVGIARQIWATEQPLDKVCVVSERTGFTKDEICHA